MDIPGLISLHVPLVNPDSNLDPARAVPRASSLAGGQHGDNFVQASLQTAEHFSCFTLLPAVNPATRHVQRTGPGERGGCRDSNIRYFNPKLNCKNFMVQMGH